MPPIPEWIAGVVTVVQGFLNRFIPEEWRPISLWGIAIAAAGYIVSSGELTIKALPLIVAVIYALASGAYTITKPAEKLRDLAEVKEEKAPALVGKSLIGLVPAIATGALVGLPTVVLSLGGAFLARLLKKRGN